MPVAAATIARVVGRLSEAQVRALLVDILVEATEPPAQPKQILTRTAPKPETVRSGCSVIDLATGKPYAANRKPKRNAAKSGNVAPPGHRNFGQSRSRSRLKWAKASPDNGVDRTDGRYALQPGDEGTLCLNRFYPLSAFWVSSDVKMP